MKDGARRLSNTQRAVQELRSLIFSGELPAGSNHLESELAERLEMSRTPVREAALTLEGQGLLEFRPRKGVRILPISVDDMREVYEVLTELESLAASLAAVRGLSDRALEPLAAAIAEMERTLERGDLEAWAEADDAYHMELVRLGGNSRVAAIVGMMIDQVRRARMVTLHIRPLPFQSIDGHRHVLEAIRNGEPERARSLHRAYCEQARETIISILEKHRLNRL